jgi:signal peptidase I
MLLPEPTQRDPKTILAAEVLQSGGSLRFRTLGTSMVPSLWPGDVVAIDSRPAADLAVGDIVLVCRDERFFLHRLIEVRDADNELCFITRGDALTVTDPPVRECQILGALRHIERNCRLVQTARGRSLLNRCMARILGQSAGLLNWAVRVRRLHSQNRPAVEPAS